MRITTAIQLLRHMRGTFRHSVYSATDQKSFARIALYEGNSIQDSATGLPLELLPDTPQWVRRAITTRAKQSSSERRRVNDSWECYFLAHPERRA